MPLTLELAAEVVRQAPGAAFLCDANGQVIHLNDGYLELSGIDPDPSAHANWVLAIHPEDRVRMFEAWGTYVSMGGHFRESFRFSNRRIGAIRWAEVTAEPLRDEQGHRLGYLGQCFDVTDRVLREEQAEQRAELLQMSDGLLGVGHWHVHANEGRLSWSDEVHTIHGTDPLEHQPSVEDAIRFYHPEDRTRVAQHVDEAVAEQQPFDFEARIIRADGGIRWVRSVGRPHATRTLEGELSLDVIGVFQDITEQKRVQQRHSLALSASQAGVWEWDPRTDALYASDRLLELFGFEAEPARMSALLERIHSGDRAAVQRALQSHLERGQTFDLVYRIIHPQHALRWIRAKGQAAFERGGRPERMVGMVYDITSEVRGRQALVEKQRELTETSDRLRRTSDDLQRFAAIAAHDMREPLRKVVWFANRVERREAGLDKRSQSDLQRIADAARGLYDMVGELMAYAKTPAAAQQREPTSLNLALEQALLPLAPTIEASHAELHVGELPTVLANPQHMRVALSNLLGNALKYVHPDRVPQIHVRGSHADGWAVVEVEDNGIGFAPEFGERIFELFERLHGRDAYPGTGLGLATVKRIVEEHGGRILARGRPGQGALFRIQLPPLAGPDPEATP